MMSLNTERKKAVFEFSNVALRELIATAAIAFSIMAFYLIDVSRILRIDELTFLIFYGMFYGLAYFIFRADTNPALSLARWVRGSINWYQFLLRISMQFLGVLAAFVVLRIMGNDLKDMTYIIVDPTTISAIDIVIIEGFMVGILVVVSFGKNVKKSYKPALLAVVYVVSIYYTLPLYTSYLNLMFIIPHALLTNTWTWHIIYFVLAHLMGVFIMVMFWIKDTWTE